jgi:hypothetical protein
VLISRVASVNTANVT